MVLVQRPNSESHRLCCPNSQGNDPGESLSQRWCLGGAMASVPATLQICIKGCRYVSWERPDLMFSSWLLRVMCTESTTVSIFLRNSATENSDNEPCGYLELLMTPVGRPDVNARRRCQPTKTQLCWKKGMSLRGHCEQLKLLDGTS